MKVKVLTRNPNAHMRDSKDDIRRVERNYDPGLHPMEAAREYTRALNAAKLQRVFAKPFVGAMDGHSDVLTVLCPHRDKLSLLYSAAADGEIRAWRTTTRQCVAKRRHNAGGGGAGGNGGVTGLCWANDGKSLLSVGVDGVINRWDCEKDDVSEDCDDEEVPAETILTKSLLYGVSHHATSNMFATCGNACTLWEESRSAPLKSFTWGVDSTHWVAFNLVETNVLATCASDRSIILYDTRESVPLRRVILKLKSNSLAWNPMEPSIFTVANEDYNLYTFDMRHLDRPMNVHKDFTAAVTSVDYSPTGKEFVAGGYDKTLRIFPVAKGHSREVYHTKRMQRITCVAWSRDARWIFSGSDEMNIRLWKAIAWGGGAGEIRRPREKAALEYAEKLLEEGGGGRGYGSHPEVKRITRKRHVPKHVMNAQKEQRESRDAKKRREANLRANSKKGAVPYVPERNKAVLKEDE